MLSIFCISHHDIDCNRLSDELNELIESTTGKHDLNVFFVRLLFCFFAEDSEIFLKGQFTTSISSHTVEDGSDLKNYIEKLFNVLNLEKRENFPEYFQSFQYVNGELFKDKYLSTVINDFSTTLNVIKLQYGLTNILVAVYKAKSVRNINIQK